MQMRIILVSYEYLDIHKYWKDKGWPWFCGMLLGAAVLMHKCPAYWWENITFLSGDSGIFFSGEKSRQINAPISSHLHQNKIFLHFRFCLKQKARNIYLWACFDGKTCSCIFQNKSPPSLGDKSGRAGVFFQIFHAGWPVFKFTMADLGEGVVIFQCYTRKQGQYRWKYMICRHFTIYICMIQFIRNIRYPFDIQKCATQNMIHDVHTLFLHYVLHSKPWLYQFFTCPERLHTQTSHRHLSNFPSVSLLPYYDDIVKIDVPDIESVSRNWKWHKLH